MASYVVSAQLEFFLLVQFVVAEDALLELAREMRAMHNTALPVMRLPHDVLVTIFLALQATYSWKFPGRLQPRTKTRCLNELRKECKTPWGWLKVTHVCQRWRIVATDCPWLWNNILCGTGYGMPTASVDLCLSSSRNLLLRSQLYIRGNIVEPPLAPQYLLRTQELHLIGSVDDARCNALADAAMPHLQTLIIQADEEDTLPVLCKNNIPSLRHLWLGYTQPCFTNFTRLRQLWLSQQSYSTVEDLSGLLDLLECTPCLEDLMFHKVEPSWDEHSRVITIDRRASLPMLKRLAFKKVTPAKICTLLDVLTIPENVMTHLQELHWSDEDPDKINNRLSQLLRRVILFATAACVSQSMVEDDYVVYALDGSRPSSIQGLLHGKYYTMDQLFARIGHALQFVPELWIDLQGLLAFPQPTLDNYRRLLRNTVLVTRLVIHVAWEACADVCLQALLCGSQGGSDDTKKLDNQDGAGDILLPYLKELEICEHGKTTDWNYLLRLLEERKQLGYPIHTLLVKGGPSRRCTVGLCRSSRH